MAREQQYGIFAGDVQCLDEAAMMEIVTHITKIESIGSRLSRVRADQWIDEDLVGEINREIDRYASDRGWRVGARDLIGGFGPTPTKPNIMSLLRRKAEESQQQR